MFGGGRKLLGIAGVLACFGLAAAIGIGAATTARAMGSDTPAEPCQQFKKGSKKWKDCRRKAGLPAEAKPEVDEAATLGYALAKADRYEEALAVLRPHEASNDARVLTYIGYAERKLGRVETAMDYYRRALAIEPNNVATLEYMGEAHLQKGNVAEARATLARIEGICGTGCEAYQTLAKAIGGNAG